MRETAIRPKRASALPESKAGLVLLLRLAFVTTFATSLGALRATFLARTSSAAAPTTTAVVVCGCHGMMASTMVSSLDSHAGTKVAARSGLLEFCKKSWDLTPLLRCLLRAQGSRMARLPTFATLSIAAAALLIL